MIRHGVQSLRRWATTLRGQAYYDHLYVAMHHSRAFRGDTWRAHLTQLREIVPDLDQRTILDFGCGPKGGLAAEYGGRVIPFDPYVSEFSAPPWSKSFDVVFSSDVLEHMTLVQIHAFLHHIRTCAPEFAFLVASTRPAHKSLPNGANAHLTVKPASWWLATVSSALGNEYAPKLALADLIRADVTLCFGRTTPSLNRCTARESALHAAG
jgi:hypothetical protein